MTTTELQGIARFRFHDGDVEAFKRLSARCMEIVRTHWSIGERAPIRALTAGVTHLVPTDQATEQLNLFAMAGMGEKPAMDREKQEKIESTIDELREKFGKGSITLGFNRLDRE